VTVNAAPASASFVSASRFTIRILPFTRSFSKRTSLVASGATVTACDGLTAIL